MTGAKNFKAIENWHIKSLSRINLLSIKYGFKLKIIDNSNLKMAALTQNMELLYNLSNIRWYLGTLCSYVAVLDFIESDNQNMIWLDLDMYINRNFNIFSKLSEDICMVYRDVDFSSMGDWAKYEYNFLGHYNIVPSKLYNSCVFKLSKQAAINIVNDLKSIGMDIFNLSDLYKMCEYFKLNDKGRFINDQCLYNASLQVNKVCDSSFVYSNFKPKSSHKLSYITHYQSDSKQYII